MHPKNQADSGKNSSCDGSNDAYCGSALSSIYMHFSISTQISTGTVVSVHLAPPLQRYSCISCRRGGAAFRTHKDTNVGSALKRSPALAARGQIQPGAGQYDAKGTPRGGTAVPYMVRRQGHPSRRYGARWSSSAGGGRCSARARAPPRPWARPRRRAAPPGA